MTGPTLPPFPPATGVFAYRRYCRACRATATPVTAGGRDRCRACNAQFLGVARTGEIFIAADRDLVTFRLVEYLGPPGLLFIRARTDTVTIELVTGDTRLAGEVVDRVWRRLDAVMDDAYLPECDAPGCTALGRVGYVVGPIQIRVFGRIHRRGERVDLCPAHAGRHDPGVSGRLVRSDPRHDESDVA